MPECPSCGKPIRAAEHLEGHLTSVNCRMRAWKKAQEARGWKRAKLGLREEFDAMGVPYALAPVEPHQGQCIYVPRWVSRILRKEKNCVFTFVGIRWLKRP